MSENAVCWVQKEGSENYPMNSDNTERRALFLVASLSLPQKSLPSPISRSVHVHLVPLTILCFLIRECILSEFIFSLLLKL